MTDSRTTYLLPCACGRENPVEPRQAGETVRCVCGRACTVPTMREVRALRPTVDAPATPGRARPAWGNPQRLLVVGIVVLLLAAAGAAIEYRQLPTHFRGLRSPEAERQFVKGLGVGPTIIYYYQRIRPGIDAPQEEFVRSERNKVYLALTPFAGVGAIGLILAGVGIARMRRPPKYYPGKEVNQY